MSIFEPRGTVMEYHMDDHGQPHGVDDVSRKIRVLLPGEGFAGLAKTISVL